MIQYKNKNIPCSPKLQFLLLALPIDINRCIVGETKLDRP